jgi:hypothetical protein
MLIYTTLYSVRFYTKGAEIMKTIIAAAMLSLMAGAAYADALDAICAESSGQGDTAITKSCAKITTVRICGTLTMDHTKWTHEEIIATPDLGDRRELFYYACLKRHGVGHDRYGHLIITGP